MFLLYRICSNDSVEWVVSIIEILLSLYTFLLFYFLIIVDRKLWFVKREGHVR